MRAGDDDSHAKQTTARFQRGQQREERKRQKTQQWPPGWLLLETEADQETKDREREALLIKIKAGTLELIILKPRHGEKERKDDGLAGKQPQQRRR